MAKLYPPSIAGTLPSFYKSNNGTTNIVVPFSMNKTVSVNSIKEFSLRVKTTNTDILYGVLTSNRWNKLEVMNPQVTFEIPLEVLNKFSIGSFYKVQLAYVDIDGVIGYYSSVGIIKFTTEPEVSIIDLNFGTTNVHKTEYIGSYYNKEDPSEKAYEYRFSLYDRDNNLLETSDWRLHNSYEDTSLTESIDKYIIQYALKRNVSYKLQYEVYTNNNLTVSSPKYLIMDAESINPEIKAKITADLDYDNACVNLNLIGEKMEDGSEYAASGLFLLSRASSLDNYSSWLPITQFKMTGELPSTFLFRDYSIAQGATYIYSLQQFNDYGIYSNRLLTNSVIANFEDAYLFDGKRQLRIRFNPKVSSFKTVVQEAKKTTLGAKHPYIFRSGAVAYKEFPISGLISYMMDNDEFFLSKSKDLYIDNWEDTTNIVDENILVERLFKLQVLDWLNDGKPKLFKSPQEGNYIVRLMNVSLSPIDSTSRMIHNFNCNATEIADFTSENLIKYGLMQADDIVTYQMRWETVVLENYYAELRKQDKSIYNRDLLRGYEAYYIKFTDTIQGTVFEYLDKDNNKHSIMIGATGAYEAHFEEPVHDLQIVLKTNANNLNIYSDTPIRGSLTFSIISANQNKFDTVTNVINKDIALHQVFGPSENILEDYSNIKRSITRIYFARFSKLDLIEVNSPLFATETEEGNLLTGEVKILNSKTIYDIQMIDEQGQIVHNYYRYFSKTEYYNLLKEYYESTFNEPYDKDRIWQQQYFESEQYKAWFEIKEIEINLDTDQNGKLWQYPHFATLRPQDGYPTIVVLNEYTLYKDSRTNKLFRLVGEQLVYNAWTAEQQYSNIYNIAYTDLIPHSVYLKRYYDGSKLIEEYYKYNGISLERLKDYSTKVEYGNVIIDVAEKNSVYIDELDAIPSKIKIGSGVVAELGLQVKFVTYSLEEYCTAQKEAYEAYYLAYLLTALSLEKVQNNTTLSLTDVYYIFQHENFIRLTPREIEDYRKRTAAVYQISEVENSPEKIKKAYDDMKRYEGYFLEALQNYIDNYEVNGL